MKKLEPINLVKEEVEKAISEGNEPYGAVIVNERGEVIASSHNYENSECDPTSHGEINAIRQACRKLKSKSLQNYSIYINYKPCPMCMSAILMTGIKSITVGSACNPPETLYEEATEKVKNADIKFCSGVDAEECSNQVLRGRQILSEIKGYNSGHKNGIF